MKTRIWAKQATVAALIGLLAGSAAHAAEFGTFQMGSGDENITCEFDYSKVSIGASSLGIYCSDGSLELPNTVITNSLDGWTILVDGESYTVGDSDPDGKTITLKEQDGGGGPTGTNNPPVAVDLSLDASVGSPLTMDLIGECKQLDPACEDVDNDELFLNSVETTADSLAGATISINNNQIEYDPPDSLPTGVVSIGDKYSYTLRDNHAGVSEAAILTIDVSEKAQTRSGECYKTTGEGCLGQTTGGTWYSLAEDQSDESRGLALFQDLDTSDKYFTLGIFSSPTDRSETHWGCGTDPLDPVRPWLSADGESCGSTGSLRNRTYAMRLFVEGGALRAEKIVVKSQGAGGDHHKWLFALSDHPYDLADDDPPEDSDTCVFPRVGAYATFATSWCDVLVAAKEWKGKNLYLLMRPVGTDAGECGESLDCRLYVNAWGYTPED